MQSFKQYISEEVGPPAGTVNHPLDKMRHETESGLDWEYNVEYKKYGGEQFSPGIKDRQHFQQLYDNAPVRHLNHDEAHDLEYSTHGEVLRHDGDKMGLVRQMMGHRRDVDRIHKDLTNGQTAYPIVLKRGNRLRIMAGNTRMSVGAAAGLNVPVKVMEVK